MANRHRGEVDLEIDGKTYTFCMDTNAMVALEDRFSTPEKEVAFHEVFERANRGIAKYIRAVFWAALRRHHPEVTEAQAGDLIQAAGGLMGSGISAALSQAAEATVPDDADVKELLEGSANPPKARAAGRRVGATTGGRSTSTPVAVA